MASPDGGPSPGADGRIFYAYRGRPVEGRFAPLALKAMHFSNRALGLMHIAGGGTASDKSAVKFTALAGCTVSPDEAMAALRRYLRGEGRPGGHAST